MVALSSYHIQTMRLKYFHLPDKQLLLDQKQMQLGKCDRIDNYVQIFGEAEDHRYWDLPLNGLPSSELPLAASCNRQLKVNSLKSLASLKLFGRKFPLRSILTYVSIAGDPLQVCTVWDLDLVVRDGLDFLLMQLGRMELGVRNFWRVLQKEKIMALFLVD